MTRAQILTPWEGIPFDTSYDERGFEFPASKSGHTCTCKDTFSSCLKVDDFNDEEAPMVSLIQGIIPDMKQI